MAAPSVDGDGDADHGVQIGWMNDPEKGDPRMDPKKNPMPLDGTRLIYGGFAPLVELSA